MASSLLLSKISVKIPQACDLFQPVVTARGLCYTFNSEAMPEVFGRYQFLNVSGVVPVRPKAGF